MILPWKSRNINATAEDPSTEPLTAAYRDDDEQVVLDDASPASRSQVESVVPPRRRLVRQPSFMKRRVTRSFTACTVFSVLLYISLAVTAALVIKPILFQSGLAGGSELQPSVVADCLHDKDVMETTVHDRKPLNSTQTHYKLTLQGVAQNFASLEITLDSSSSDSELPAVKVDSYLYSKSKDKNAIHYIINLPQAHTVAAHLWSPQHNRGCVRQKTVLHIPSQVKHLEIVAHPTTELKFDPTSFFNLDVLSITLLSPHAENAIYPTDNVLANSTTFKMNGGQLFGSTKIVHRTTVVTEGGNALAELYVSQFQLPDNSTAPASLDTSIGSGRMNLVYDRTHGAGVHRPILSTHTSDGRNSQIHLNYTQSEFSGKVLMRTSKIENGSYFTGGLPRVPSSLVSYVGDREGLDSVTIHSNGEVGLFFGGDGK
ncbi:hypothetical protein K474DRAFT_926421 [Panus rudis PR-1116 ss-1]|nr:hypothetical protein K474DRAFT_926421 [Panus rudis PR-1116 ss-1]